MKARKLHEVPLSEQACTLIEDVLKSHNAPFVFHGRNPEKPLSNMAMLGLIKKQLKQYDTTVHGLRATFRTWGSEMTHYDGYVLEFALAHQLNTKGEKAYLQSTLIGPRIPLMQDWANYLTSNETHPNIESSMLN